MERTVRRASASPRHSLGPRSADKARNTGTISWSFCLSSWMGCSDPPNAHTIRSRPAPATSLVGRLDPQHKGLPNGRDRLVMARPLIEMHYRLGGRSMNAAPARVIQQGQQLGSDRAQVLWGLGSGRSRRALLA